MAHASVEQLYRVNIIGTRNLLESLAAQGRLPSAMLLASSAHVYGNASGSHIDEGVTPAPANDYAVSKMAMECMACLWSEKLPLTIARPFNYTGVGQSECFLLPKMVAHFKRRMRRIELGNLDIARDFSDVRMVAASYRLLLAAGPCGEVVNICSGTAYSLAGVFSIMADIAGYRIEVGVNPALVRSNDVRSLAGSGTRLRALIGAQQPIALADTLRWMYGA